jgi:RING finger protein 170
MQPGKQCFFLKRKLTNRHAHAQLHPDSLADITVTRELLAQQNEQPSATTRTRRFNRTDSAQCPICLGPFDYPTETNCGHAFCGSFKKNKTKLLI